MLTKTYTALILLIVFLTVLFSSSLLWQVFVILMTALGAGEWFNLFPDIRSSIKPIYNKILRSLYLGFTFLISLAIFRGLVKPEFIEIFIQIALLFWLIIVPIWLHKKWNFNLRISLNSSKKYNFIIISYINILIIFFLGWLLLIPLSILALKFPPRLLLIILSVVWLTDISAYFVGKSMGKHKIAPYISPSKTWEGAIGAMISIVITYSILLWFHTPFKEDNFFIQLGIFMFITLMSIIGDLFESLLKRQANIKDSGNHLPGHGGILDRIDSLTAVAPVVLFLQFVGKI